MINLKRSGLFLLFILAMASSCSPKVAEKLSLEEYESLMADKKKLQLIDVRTPQEFEAGHILNAVMIDFKAADFRTQVKNLKKRKPIAVYCKSGNRSGQAFAILQEMGFRKIYDLEGGITAWIEAEKKIKK
ncbi:MAG: rhodanese-related sulfurtransferase [Roseivirga sp.]|jgi:rhodanese-related sulfurtransferase